MPWYMNPTSSRKVINRIAASHSHDSLKELQDVLDRATQGLWRKQEYYHTMIQRKAEVAKL